MKQPSPQQSIKKDPENSSPSDEKDAMRTPRARNKTPSRKEAASVVVKQEVDQDAIREKEKERIEKEKDREKEKEKEKKQRDEKRVLEEKVKEQISKEEKKEEPPKSQSLKPKKERKEPRIDFAQPETKVVYQPKVISSQIQLWQDRNWKFCKFNTQLDIQIYKQMIIDYIRGFERISQVPIIQSTSNQCQFNLFPSYHSDLRVQTRQL